MDYSLDENLISHVYLMRAKDEVYKPEAERVRESGKNIYEGKFRGPLSCLILYVYPYKFLKELNRHIFVNVPGT
jgi:hypothetical protein